MKRISLTFCIAVLFATVLPQNSNLEARQTENRTEQSNSVRKSDRSRAQRSAVEKRMAGLVWPVLKPVLPSIALMKSGHRTAGMGIVISDDGKILTKRSSIRVGMSTEVDGTVHKTFTTIGILKEADLAVVKIEAKGLTVAEFAEITPAKGEWLITPTRHDSSAMLGTMSESVHRQKQHRPFLGVQLAEVNLGDGSQAIRVSNVVSGTAAHRHGLLRNDLIKAVGGELTDTQEKLLNELTKFSAGDLITLVLERDGKEISKSVQLGASPATEKSPRFAMAFGHDTELRQDKLCGGPIVDLKGRIVGINVSGIYRRTETGQPIQQANGSFNPMLVKREVSNLSKAIPSEYINLKLEALTNGQLAPSIVNRALLEQNAAQTKLSEDGLAALKKSTESLKQDTLGASEQAKPQPSVASSSEKIRKQLLERDLKRLKRQREQLLIGN